MLQLHDSNLVFVEHDRPATTSLMIAEAFEKGHDKVLRDIKNLKCSESFRLANFGESEYKNRQGRKMPCFIVSQDGFAMLAMGYSGEKAVRFKERYIAEFNRIRHILESQKTKKLLLELREIVTLLSFEQSKIQQEIRDTILLHYSHLKDGARRKYYAHIHKDIREMFNVQSFRDIRRCDYDDAINFIRKWHSPNLESRKKVGVTT